MLMERDRIDSEDQLRALRAPQAILPSQFFPSTAHRPNLRCEYRLLAAMLEDAVDIYRRGHTARLSRRQKLYRETERWLRSHDRDWVFSFERVCEALDIDPEYVRRGLRAWRGELLRRSPLQRA